MLASNKIEESMSHEEVVERAQSDKINLNKYGKMAEKLRVYSPDEIKLMFEWLK